MTETPAADATGTLPDTLTQRIGVLARRELEKGLAATEREVLDTAKSMLASELAVVEDLELATAASRLDDVIAERVAGA